MPFSGKNVSCKWISGNQYFYDINGNEIFHVDGASRKFVLPSGSTLDASAASALLPGGSGIAALIGGGLGNSAAYTKASTGTLTLLAANATKTQAVLLVAVCTQTFADGDGGQPTFKVGQDGTTNKFWDTTAFTGMTVGTVVVTAGLLTATDKLIVTAVAGTGTTETGGIAVTVVAIPTS